MSLCERVCVHQCVRRCVQNSTTLYISQELTHGSVSVDVTLSVGVNVNFDSSVYRFRLRKISFATVNAK